MDGFEALVRVQRAIAGDAAAQSALWREYRRAVATVALAYCPRQVLDDIVQEVALAFVKEVVRLREPERFEPWLMQIARNAARGNQRRERIRRTDELPLELPGRTTQHDDSLVDAIARLPDDLREPLLLKCVDGLPQRRVAELLGLPETTIETRLVRARQFLRERLSEATDDSRLKR